MRVLGEWVSHVREANQKRSGPCEYGRVAVGTMRNEWAKETYKKVRIDGKQAETGRNIVWPDGRRIEHVFSDCGDLGARGKRGRWRVWARERRSYGRGRIG